MQDRALLPAEDGGPEVQLCLGDTQGNLASVASLCSLCQEQVPFSAHAAGSLYPWNPCPENEVLDFYRGKLAMLDLSGHLRQHILDGEQLRNTHGRLSTIPSGQRSRVQRSSFPNQEICYVCQVRMNAASDCFSYMKRDMGDHRLIWQLYRKPQVTATSPDLFKCLDSLLPERNTIQVLCSARA